VTRSRTPSRGYERKGNQRAEFVKGTRDKLEDVAFAGVKIGDNSPTGKAVLVTINGTELWMPHSQITAIDKEAGTLTITGWIAKEKGLA
jgi:hypothetical protein